MKKIFLSFLVLVFAVSAGICFEFMPADIVNVYVPEYYGKVYDSFVGNNDKSVIYIQDAHCDYTAQKNVVKILKTFVDDYNCKMVAVEGSSGDIDTTLLSSYPDSEVKEKISDYFMVTGQLSGAEYFSVNSGKKFFLVGIENKKLYIDNVEAFRNAFNKYADIEASLNNLNKGFTVLKQALYNEELKKFTDKMFAFKEEKITFSQYFDFLYDLAKKENINLEVYPNFNLLAKASLLKDKIDFLSVDSERGRVLAVLGNQLKGDALAELIEKSLKFKQKELSYLAYYSYLKKAGSLQKIKGIGNFSNYTDYIILLNQVDKVSLQKEQEQIITALLDVLYNNKKQGSLFELDRKFSVLHDLFGLKIDRMDFLYYKDNKGDFRSKKFAKFLKSESLARTYLPSKDNLKEIDSSVSVAESFYNIALKREDSFVDNLLAQMDMRNVKTAVLVGGGFHSEGVMEKLKKENISYSVITPMTDAKQQKVIDEKYVSFMQGKKTSFMNFLEGKDQQGKEALPGVIGALPFMNIKDNKSFVLALESVFLRGENKSTDKDRSEAFPLDFASKLLSYSLAKGEDVNALIDQWKDNYANEEDAIRGLITELSITDQNVIDALIAQYLEGSGFLNQLFNRFSISQPVGTDVFPELAESEMLNFVHFRKTDVNMVYHFYAEASSSLAEEMEAEFYEDKTIDRQGDNFESFSADDFVKFLSGNIERFFGDVFSQKDSKDKMAAIENNIGLSKEQRFAFFTELVKYLEESIGVNANQKWGIDLNTVMETTDFKVIFNAYLKNREASMVIFSDDKDDVAMKSELTNKLSLEGYNDSQIKDLMRKITFINVNAQTMDIVMGQQNISGVIISNQSFDLKQKYINSGRCNYLISEENTSLPVLFNVLSVVTDYNFNLSNLPTVIPQELKDLGIKNTEDLRNLFTSPFPVNVKATVLLDNLHFANEAVSRAA